MYVWYVLLNSTYLLTYLIIVGAQDFLPDFSNTLHWKSFRPSYSCLGSAIRKVKDWLKAVKVSITMKKTYCREAETTECIDPLVNTSASYVSWYFCEALVGM